MIFSVLVGYSVLERPDFTNFRGDIWLVLSKKNICRENNSILSQLKEEGSGRLTGDGMCDSPTHSAKYLTYSFMDQITNKIAAMTITQVTEAKNSNNVEKVGFMKGLKFLRINGVTVDQITNNNK